MLQVMKIYFPNFAVEWKVKIFFFFCYETSKLKRNLKIKRSSGRRDQLNQYECVTFLYFFPCMHNETHLNNFDLGMIAVD